MADILDGPAAFVKWPQMTRAQRAHAVYIQLRRRWQHVDLRKAASYDKLTRLVVVEHSPGGTSSWSVCKREAAETLQLIEETYGAAARAEAEAVIDADAVPERRGEIDDG